MEYMIFDSTGNALGAYEDEVEAHAALREIAETEPAAADVALLAYAGGMPVGEAVTPTDLPIATSSVEMSRWTLALGGTRGVWLGGWMPETVSPGRRVGAFTAAGVAAARGWEERLAESAAVR